MKEGYAKMCSYNKIRPDKLRITFPKIENVSCKFIINLTLYVYVIFEGKEY